MQVKYSDLKNKRVFITGGGSGIGASIVEHFCEQGSEVYFVDIDLKETSDEISFTASGSNIEIPIKDYEFENIANLNNKEVFFGIRPEHIYFKKSNESDFEVTMRADLSEYIGHEQIMTFDYSNQEILAKFPSTIKIELAKETKLFFDLTQTSLFDAQTEERI